MSCEYCRGEKPLISCNVPNRDGVEFETAIARGQFIGTRVYKCDRQIIGVCDFINYCPKCGQKLREGD